MAALGLSTASHRQVPGWELRQRDECHLSHNPTFVCGSSATPKTWSPDECYCQKAGLLNRIVWVPLVTQPNPGT